MKTRKIAITSASSFTALWIAKAFHEAGWEIHALCQSDRSAYSDLRLRRIELLEGWAKVHYSVGVLNGAMEKWIRSEQPDLWIHHHHFMDGFRSPKYDLERSRSFGIA